MATCHLGAELLDAVLIRVSLEDAANGLNLMMLARNDAAAEQLQDILQNGLEMGRQIDLAQAMNELDRDDPLAEASRAYAQRISNKVVELLTPDRVVGSLS